MRPPYLQQPSREEQLIYDHLLERRKLDYPEDVLERFLSLFIDGSTYSDPKILEAVHRVAMSRLAEQEFKYLLSRCCRILTNYWWFQPHFRWAVVELVELLSLATPGVAATFATKRLRQLTRQFLQTEEYQSLRRLAQVVEGTSPSPRPKPAEEPSRLLLPSDRPVITPKQKTLGSLIHRYPYLYPHCLGGEASDGGQRAIEEMQAQTQRQYERDLSRYVTHLVQQSQTHQPRSGNWTNPTLLTDQELKAAVRHFAGKMDGQRTCREASRRLLTYSAQGPSYREFKEHLYQYLTSSFGTEHTKYREHHFNSWLHTHLRNTLPQSDTERVSSFLIGKTCHQLLEALVASPQQTNHYVFLDLISNVGATVTIGLVLKVLLLYNNLRSNVEKRFAVLFKHYEHLLDGVDWLIHSLENLNIALSIHFGKVSFPCINQL